VAIPPWVGIMSIGLVMVMATAGKKRQVLRSSRPCYQDICVLTVDEMLMEPAVWPTWAVC